MNKTKRYCFEELKNYEIDVAKNSPFLVSQERRLLALGCGLNLSPDTMCKVKFELLHLTKLYIDLT